MLVAIIKKRVKLTRVATQFYKF